MGTATEVEDLIERYRQHEIHMKELPSKQWFGCIMQGWNYLHTLPKAASIPLLTISGKAWIDDYLEGTNDRLTTDAELPDVDSLIAAAERIAYRDGADRSEERDGSTSQGQK